MQYYIVWSAKTSAPMAMVWICVILVAIRLNGSKYTVLVIVVFNLRKKVLSILESNTLYALLELNQRSRCKPRLTRLAENSIKASLKLKRTLIINEPFLQLRKSIFNDKCTSFISIFQRKEDCAISCWGFWNRKKTARSSGCFRYV